MTPGVVEVVLADDEPLTRAGLALLIGTEAGLRVVGEAGDGLQAVELTRRLAPQVAVLDVRMPGLDGVQAARQILAPADGRPVPAVLMLTTFNDQDAVRDAVHAGVSGYLLKSAAPRSLGEAIRAVAAGKAWLDPAVARTVLADLADRPRSPLPTGARLAELTSREREILALIAHGLSNAQISAHLVISDATVKTHLGRVLAKLGLHDRAQAVAMAYRSGLVHPLDGMPRPSA